MDLKQLIDRIKAMVGGQSGSQSQQGAGTGGPGMADPGAAGQGGGTGGPGMADPGAAGQGGGTGGPGSEEQPPEQAP